MAKAEVEQHALAGDTPPGAGVAWSHVGADVGGPLLTLAVAIGFDLLNRQGYLVSNPFTLLLLTVVFSALLGGLRSGIISAVLVVLYGVHFLSDPGTLLDYSDANRRGLVLLALAAPATAVLVARLRPAHREPASVAAGAAARRTRALSEAGALLASSSEYDVTLQSMARLVVPAFADWCVVHVLDERGRLAYVSGAHRDPGREVLVHAVRRYPPADLAADGAGHSAPRLIDPLDETALAAVGTDAEHRRLLRALGTRAVLIVPFVSRGRVLGALTLAMAESGRGFDAAAVADAEQLAGRIALALDNAELLHDALRAERRFRLVFEANPQPMWIFDVESLNVLAVNDAAIRHYGYERDEFVGMSIMDLRADDEPPVTLADRTAPRGHVALAQHRKKDGSVLDVEIASHEITFDGTRARLVQITDVTERARARAALHRTEEQLRRAQRMDAVGRLAEGVAHDFNNLLTAIQGFSEIMLRDLGDDDPRRKDLEHIRRAADRGALLTRQLLAFARREQVRPELLQLNEMITAMEPLFQRLVGADVRLATVLAPTLGPVRIDPAQMEQVLMNLVLAARDAMPDGGTLSIETGERHVGSQSRSRRIRPGRYVVLLVSDTGRGDDGSDAEEPARDPLAGAAGFGLSMVYGIARQYGGVVRVTSEAGGGTTVRVYLPRAAEQPLDVADVVAEPEALLGRETVLLVEDEEAVRELLRKVLARQGYDVLEARHGKDALLLVEHHPGPIHLVVTDVVMPEMGGRELVEQLKPLRPDLKVLYISGYTNDEIVRRGIAEPDLAFIQKPFSSDEFVRRVRELLDAGEPGMQRIDARA